MKWMVLCGLLLSLFVCGTVSAGSYSYVKADDFKSWLQDGRSMAIVDIQPGPDFQKQHFRDAIETNAYPAKTDEERKRLDKALPRLEASRDDIVIICPRGGGGAKGAYDYLKGKGIDEKRLFILEGGMQGWPHKGVTVLGKP